MSAEPTPQTRKLPPLLDLSADGLALLQRLEGYRLRSYLDSGGKKTIGYGHLMLPGEPDRITKEEAARLLRIDVGRMVKQVRKAVRVPLWQSEFDALVIFAFNIGETAFRKSTLVRRLNSLNYREASHEFGRWVFVNGVRNKGLINRRDAERRLFNTVPF